MKIRLLLLMVTVVSCSSEKNSGDLRSLEKVTVDQLSEHDEAGNVASLEGFSESDKIQENTNLAENENLREMFIEDTSLFSFKAPEGHEAEFSEPIMITGSQLRLTNQSNKQVCEPLAYQQSEPTMKQMIEISKEKNTCGPVNVSFCIRLSFQNISEQTQNYTYVRSPNIKLNIPCPEDSFTNLNINIAAGAQKTTNTTEKIDFTALRSVIEIYLTNSNDCESGGNWQFLGKESLSWMLDWSDGKKTSTVYAKFRDIFGNESQCVEDSIDYGSDPAASNAGNSTDGDASTSGNTNGQDTGSSDTQILQVSAGASHTCALLKHTASGIKSLKCWGLNSDGRLGLGHTLNIGTTPGEMGLNLSSVDLGEGRSPASVMSGKRTCTLLDGGQVTCWGSGGWGFLGFGNEQSVGGSSDQMGNNLSVINLGSGQPVTQVSGMEDTLCTLLGDGSVKCWGRNTTGQCALGYAQGGCGQPGLNPSINLGSGKSAVQISTGYMHVCALLNDNSVKCWGNNYNGQLGTENLEKLGDESDEIGDGLLPINLGTNDPIKNIYSGHGNNCVIFDDSASTVKCWGKNNHGELGVGHTNHIGDESGEMGSNLKVTDLGGTKPLQLALGLHHSCALLEGGLVKCWGRNNLGQLGKETTTDLGDQSNEMGHLLTPINLGTGRTAVQIAVGDNHSCALLDNNTLKCWGDNQFGQLGFGHTNSIGDNSGEMGDQLSIVDLGI